MLPSICFFFFFLTVKSFIGSVDLPSKENTQMGGGIAECVDFFMHTIFFCLFACCAVLRQFGPLRCHVRHVKKATQHPTARRLT